MHCGGREGWRRRRPHAARRRPPRSPPPPALLAAHLAATSPPPTQILALNEVCPLLTRLDVSKNALTSLGGVALCSRLRWLSAAGNRLESADALRDLEALEVGGGAAESLPVQL